MDERGAVVIELDCAPASLKVPTSGDYLEQCVVSALFSPALRIVAASPGFDYFEFVVDEGQRFSDGSQVCPRHVLETLERAARSPQWARYIAYLDKTEIVGERLCLSLRRPACFYPDMLGTVDFSPTHPGGLGNGPYRIGEYHRPEQGYYHLTPNPHVKDADERPELVFRLQTDVDGAPDRFLRGECDITCGTAFPLDRLDEWRSSDALHQAPTGIFMQLEPNPSGEGPLADRSLRRAMLECLDLTEIAADFPGGLRPVPRPEAVQQAQIDDVPAKLRVSYHDFYPNRQVLEKLSAQWRDRLGLTVDLIQRAYADRREDDADASFVLRYLPFNHPYAYFDQCAILMKDVAFDRQLDRFAAEVQEAEGAMNHQLRQELPMLRVFEVVGNWLAGPRVAGFRWPSDAVFDFAGLRRVEGGDSP